jgi:hypothetical protein
MLLRRHKARQKQEKPVEAKPVEKKQEKKVKKKPVEE